VQLLEAIATASTAAAAPQSDQFENNAHFHELMLMKRQSTILPTVVVYFGIAAPVGSADVLEFAAVVAANAAAAGGTVVFVVVVVAATAFVPPVAADAAAFAIAAAASALAAAFERRAHGQQHLPHV
jgi:hypothetical protein